MKNPSWINKYWDLQAEIDELEWDIRKTQLEQKRWEKNGDLFNNNKYETSLHHQQRIGQVLVNLENVLEDKQKLKQELLDLINNFKGLDNKILYLKYVEGMTLEVVAQELNYSYSYIKSKHAEIKRSFKIMNKILDK